MRIVSLIHRELWFCFMFLCFYFYFAGAGAREIIIDCKYNSAVRGTTNTWLYIWIASLKCEPSTCGLTGLDNFAAWSINIEKTSSEMAPDGHEILPNVTVLKGFFNLSWNVKWPLYCPWNVKQPFYFPGKVIKILPLLPLSAANRPRLLKAWLALTSVKYHGNL